MSSGFPDGIVTGAAIAAGFIFAITHFSRTRSRRDESGRRSDLTAMLGLVIEAIGAWLPFVWPHAGRIESAGWHWFAAALAIFSTVVIVKALIALGPQWRIQAVVTEGHQLVTSGPYRFVRHPIYAAVLGFVIAFGIAYSNWTPLAVGVAIYLIGTELRVRAEDNLLRGRFGPEFEAYRSRVRAYIPGVR